MICNTVLLSMNGEQDGIVSRIGEPQVSSKRIERTYWPL
jgi:hypothetical protein